MAFVVLWPWFVVPWHKLHCYRKWQLVDTTEVLDPVYLQWVWVAVANQVLWLVVIPLTGAVPLHFSHQVSKFLAVATTEVLGWIIFFDTTNYPQLAHDHPHSPIAQCLDQPGFGFVGFWTLFETIFVVGFMFIIVPCPPPWQGRVVDEEDQLC